MVGVPRWSPLLVSMLIVAVALAGCVDDDTPAPAGDPQASAQPDPSASRSPNATVGPLVDVDKDKALFAPAWKKGMVWTYAVSGTLFPTPYDAKIGVVEVAEDRYVLATDALPELMNFAHFEGGVFLGGVEPESLAIAHGGGVQDLFGFQRPTGDRWQVTFFEEGFQFTKPDPSEVTHALGKSRGIDITATGTRGELQVVYAASVGNLALLRWTDGAQVLLEYKITGYAASGDISGMRQWTILTTDHGDASGPPNNVGAEQWASDGAGSLVFLRTHLKATTASGAIVIDPSGDVVVQAQGEDATKDTIVDVTVPDEQGTWNMLLWNDSGAVARGPSARSDVFLYQIEEIVY